MKKNIIIVVIIVLGLGVLGLLIMYLVQFKPTLNINQQPNLNISSEEAAKKAAIQAVIDDHEQYQQKISEQKITRGLHDQLLNFQSFCSITEDGANLLDNCRNILSYYWGEWGIFEPCFKTVWHPALIYFYKTNNQAAFINLCQDSINIWAKDTYEQKTITAQMCQKAWDDKVWQNQNICASQIKKGWPILATGIDGKCSLELPMSSEGTTLDALKPGVKDLFYFIKANNEKDCEQITTDPLVRLICVAAYSRNACADIQGDINTLNLPDFIKKYQLEAMNK